MIPYIVEGRDAFQDPHAWQNVTRLEQNAAGAFNNGIFVSVENNDKVNNECFNLEEIVKITTQLESYVV